MSRTIRRKNHSRTGWDTDYNIINGVWTTVPLEGKSLKRKLHKLHGDNHSGRWTPPGSFVTDLNRSLRSKNKHILRVSIINNDFDDMSMICNVKDAAWHWW